MARLNNMDGRAQPEDLLLEAAQGLRQHRSGRLALHVKVSRLQAYHQEPYYLRELAACFAPAVRSDSARSFRLQNRDLVFTYQVSGRELMERGILQAFRLFRDDPLIVEAEAKDEALFCERIDLAEHFEAFLSFAESIHASPGSSVSFEPNAQSEGSEANDEPSEVSFPPGQRTEALDGIRELGAPKRTVGSRSFRIPDLDKIQRQIESLDARPYLRRWDICAIVGDDPVPAMSEWGVSTWKIVEDIRPGINPFSDIWLYHHLAGVVSGRLLSALAARSPVEYSHLLHLKVTLETIITEDFRTFEERPGAIDRRRVVLDFPIFDVLSDIPKYIQLRDTLKQAGYLIAISYTEPTLLPVVEREGLTPDFMKVAWPGGEESRLPAGWAGRFAEGLSKISPERIILTGCTSADAIAFGRNFDISLFHGPQIDQMQGK